MKVYFTDLYESLLKASIDPKREHVDKAIALLNKIMSAAADENVWQVFFTDLSNYSFVQSLITLANEVIEKFKTQLNEKPAYLEGLLIMLKNRVRLEGRI